AVELDLLVVEYETAVAHRTVGENLQIGFGTFHGAQVAAMLFDLVLESGPRGELVGHTNLFDRSQINYFQIEMLRLQWPGLDVILNALRQAGEEKLESRTSRLRLHGYLFPFRGALEARVQPRIRSLQAGKLSRNELVRIAPNR